MGDTRLRLKTVLLVAAAVLLAAGGAALGLGLYVQSTLNGTLSAQCTNRPVVDLAMDEVISLRKRRRAYSRGTESSEFFEVSGREASFILAGELDMGVWVEVLEDRLVATLTIPDDQGCYNVEYVGGIDVDGGALRLAPESLVVGDTDLTSWFYVADGLWGIDPVADTPFVKRVANIEHLDVADGRIRLRYRDRKKGW